MKKFAGLLTAGLVAATLTACNDKEAKSDATKAQAPANDTVYLYTWTEYVPDGLLDDFTKETGIKVIVASLESNETMYAKMKTQGDAGGYDVIAPSNYFVSKMGREGMLQELLHLILTPIKVLISLLGVISGNQNTQTKSNYWMMRVKYSILRY